MDHKRIYNWKKDTIDHRDFIAVQKITPKTPTSIDLRTSISVTVYDQGNLGSCVANGTSYCIQYDQIKTLMTHKFQPSRLYIYYNTRVIEGTVNEDSGTSVRGALISTNRNGSCPETLWPYTISKFATKPSSESYTSGGKHLVTNYVRIIQTLDQMRQSLIDGYPIVFGMVVYESFGTIDSTGNMPLPSQGETILGGHCMAIVGYNDATSRFIVRNSWGGDWGDHGYCYIPYSYLTSDDYTWDLWSVRQVSDTEAAPAPPAPVVLRITKAMYGIRNKYINVTDTVAKYFKKNTSMVINNKNMGKDPYKNVKKQIIFTLSNNTTKTYPEGATVRLSQIIAVQAIPVRKDITPPKSAVVITSNIISKVIYGVNTDITTLIKDHFSQGRAPIRLPCNIFPKLPDGEIMEVMVTLVDGHVRKYGAGDIINFL
jgi:hypothetical protein